MTSLVRRYLKTAVGFLALGLALGVWMLAERELRGRFAAPLLVSAHTHAILVGFVMLMILGVALWLFPRPAQGDTRYSPARAEAAYWLVTLGTLVRVVGEVARAVSDARTLRWTVFAAGLAQALGLVVYFTTGWTRIRAAGSALREQKGERF